MIHCWLLQKNFAPVWRLQVPLLNALKSSFMELESLPLKRIFFLTTAHLKSLRGETLRILFFLFLPVFFLLGCGSSPSLGRVHKLECRHWRQSCLLKARSHCPGDYNVVRVVELQKQGGSRGFYKLFEMHIRCN